MLSVQFANELTNRAGKETRLFEYFMMLHQMDISRKYLMG